MNINEKELEKDESFVVEAKEKYSEIQYLQSALEDYFIRKYGARAEISLSFDEAAHVWVVATKNGQRKVNYLESIPKALHEIL
ncbi:hypothetical protein HY497_01640 [Candidatus Woesearchaeota archaeon]|nr:hypothetical protein [Candidatus Woesearchaeota archaeon]